MDKRGERLVLQPGDNHVYAPVKESKQGFVKVRYIFAVLGFILMAIIYGLKVNLSVAMVGMMNHTAHSSGPLNVTQSDCPGDPRDATSHEDGLFEWGEEVKGLILSSYFFGYLISQVPGGRVAEVLSAKWILFASVALNIIPTILTPPAALIHWSLLIILRIIEGVGGGFSFPALHVMISKWSPVEERSVISSIVYAGTAVGTVLSLLFTGLIVEHINWEAAFYIMGGLSSIWLILWWFLISDSPHTHPFISDEERNFIATSLGEDTEKKPHKVVLKVPWRSVWTSAPFLAILVSHMFSNCGWYTLLIETPIYYDQVLKISMKKITLASSIPFFTLWLFSLGLSGCLSKLIAKKTITVTTARKVATFFGILPLLDRCFVTDLVPADDVTKPVTKHVSNKASAVPAVCLVAVNIAGCNQMAIFMFMGIGTTCMGGMFSGVLSNHIDIAPNFAGTLMGITNTIATLPGIVVPLLVGKLTKVDHTREQWSIIFYGAAAFLVAEAVVFTLFASGKEQPWNKPKTDGDTEQNQQLNKVNSEQESEDTKM